MFVIGSKFLEQLWKRITLGSFLWSLIEIHPVVSEEKIFKEKFTTARMDRRTHYGHNAMTIAPLAESHWGYCHGVVSVVRPSVRASVRQVVNFFFKNLLLRNYWMNFNQTSQEWSLGDPLSKLFKKFWSNEKHGFNGRG